MPNLLAISPPGYAYICIGGFIALFSTVSFFARERAYVNEVVLATAFGILMGPLGADIFDPRSWSNESDRITLEVTRVVLATGLFAIGAELPKGYMFKHVKGLLIMVVPTMTVGWFIVAGLLKAIFNRFGYVTCLVIAACLTPTDPIISASVIGGGYAKKHVPEEIRNILVAESAANDGLAYPFISLSLYLLLEPRVRDAFKKWVLIGCLFQVILGTVIGAVIGYIFSHVMKFSHKQSFSNHESYMAQYFALAILTVGIINTIGSDDLLGAFAAGCAFTSWADDDETSASISIHIFSSTFASVLDYILNCGCFIYIGAWFRWEDFTSTELGIRPWKLVVFSISILILRRLPVLLMLYKWVPEIKDVKEALFCGHFGPMGVGALFIATLAKHRLPEPRGAPQTQEDYLTQALHSIVGFVILVSIIIHGLSIAFVTFGKKVYRRAYSSKTNNAFKSRTLTADTLVALSPQVEMDTQRMPLNDPSNKEKCFSEISGSYTNAPLQRTPDPEVPFPFANAASDTHIRQSSSNAKNVATDSNIEKAETKGIRNDVEAQMFLAQ